MRKAGCVAARFSTSQRAEAPVEHMSLSLYSVPSFGGYWGTLQHTRSISTDL